MRILVGILYSGEPQYSDCIESVEGQENCLFDYFVIENLTKNEAHNTLYSTFMSKSGEYDLYVKLDADMVIQHCDFFKYLEQLFSNNKILDHLHLYIYDGILNTLISGLNVYRSCVEWALNKDNFYTDRTHSIKSIRQKLVVDNPERNWVVHCPKASNMQVFNFGLHRGIKAFQYNATVRRRNTMHGLIVLVFLELEKKGHPNIIYAIIGFIWAIKFKLRDNVINRDDVIRRELEFKLSGMEITTIRNELDKDWYLTLYKLCGKYAYYFLFYFKT